jgi:hypothetical protein
VTLKPNQEDHVYREVLYNHKVANMTTPQDIVDALAQVTRYAASLKAFINRTRIKLYKSTGLQTKQLKVWYGTVTSSSGAFTFNISSAGFTEILHVSPQVIFNSTDFNKQGVVSISTMSLTSITGKTFTGDDGANSRISFESLPAATVMIKVEGF